MPKLFVYGTLKKGYTNHYILEMLGAELIGKAMLPNSELYVGRLPDCRRLPYLIKGDDKVSGELYHVPKKALKYLDIFEGVPHFYNREKLTVTTRDDKVEAWIYVFQEDGQLGHCFKENKHKLQKCNTYKDDGV